MSQKDYCEWKASMFNSKLQYIEKNGFSQKPAVRYVSKIFGYKGEFLQNKTSCPQWIIDKLDARGIAVWFMDDGSMQGNCATISTCSFDKNTQIRLVKKLKSLGIDCHYKFDWIESKKKGYYYIKINGEGYRSLCNLIIPYIHKNIFYKVNGANEKTSNYKWNNKFENCGVVTVKSIKPAKNKECVYDIGVKDNHNFIVTTCKTVKNLSGLIAHNCQDHFKEAINNTNKLLSQAKWGNSGIQVFFGTPKQRNGFYWDIWQMSNQQYYHLGCEKCGKHFPLYTAGSDEWKKIWLYGFTVKCVHCGHEQDKRDAAERGKWVPLIPGDTRYIGYHINQLYMPNKTREKIDDQRPEVNPEATERGYQNEVLGEFYRGEASPITPEEIKELCADKDRRFAASISMSERKNVYAGFDWGKKNYDDGKSHGGQSYSSSVILSEEGPNLLSIQFATLLKRNDLETKKEIVDEMFRKYSVKLGVGDIGYANDLSELLHREHADRFLVSQASAHVNNRIKFDGDVFPKTITFERDYHIQELFGLMKRGMIRFPFGNYEQIAWLVSHCCSMEVKTTTNIYGDPIERYIKGTTPNDGFMALLNAYLAYKFDVTKGFTNKTAGLMGPPGRNKVSAIAAYLPRY
jgi:hypothetical protein